MSLASINPRRYGVTLDRGFLIPAGTDPIRFLPIRFRAFQEAMEEMPDHLIKSTWGSVLPNLMIPADMDMLTMGERWRLHSLCAFAMHAYMWEQWRENIARTIIPANLAVPFAAVSRLLGIPPSLVYAVYASCNWYRIDPEGPFTYDNIQLLCGFTRSPHERGFVVPHILIEKEGGKAVYAAIRAQEAAMKNRKGDCELQLLCFAEALRKMNATLVFLSTVCDPGEYFDEVRPCLHGSTQHALIPNGIIYEGVGRFGGKPQKFPGETGAQSSLIPLFDRAAGVVHDETDILSRHLRVMLDVCTPPRHRALIRRVEKRTPIRTFVLKNTGLRDFYNACVKEMIRFRKKHYEYTVAYISKQNRLHGTLANPSSVGTGGTDFTRSLLQHIKDTERALV